MVTASQSWPNTFGTFHPFYPMRSFPLTNRPLRRLAAFLLIVLATGCITIEEHYTFKKNGSGTMEYVMDMSALAGLMDAFDQGSGKSKEKKNDGPTGTGFDERAEQLKHVQGIKRVKQKNEEDGFIQRVSFAFQDLDALNRALNVLMPDSTGTQQTFFRWEGNTLVRTNNNYAKQLGGEMGDGADSTELSGMLESMKYKYSFKFAKQVADVQLAEGVTKESPSPKKLELATDWSVIMKDPNALDLRITLDN